MHRILQQEKHMVSFDKDNPFPRLGVHSYSRPEIMHHAQLADEFLGLRVHEIEQKLSHEKPSHYFAPDKQMWIGLPSETLLTPYLELSESLYRLNLPEASRIVELGCAYARLAFVVAYNYPSFHYIGFEAVYERIEEGRRCLKKLHSTHYELHCEDISRSDFKIPPADCYFIYDYGHRLAIEKSISELRDIARTQPILVVGRGRGIRDEIERKEAWLSQVVPPEHCGNFTIYSSAERKKTGAFPY